MQYLRNALETYRSGVGEGYKECAIIANGILNKWYREKHEIGISYDANGEFNKGWREL